MTLAEIMTQPPITVRDDATLDEVAARLIGQQVGCLPVVGPDGQLVGIVTPCDFGAKQAGCRFPPFCASGFPGEPLAEPARGVREIMTPRPIVLTEDATVVEAVAKMLHLGFDHIPVVRNGVPVGMVAREDLLQLTLRLLSGWPRGLDAPAAADANARTPASSDGVNPSRFESRPLRRESK